MLSLTDTRRVQVLDDVAELLALNPTASLVEIAAYAKIGKATLHRYFSSREELMLALGFQALELISKALENCQLEQGSVIEALTRAVQALVPLGDKLHFLLSEPILDHHPGFTAADRSTQEPVLRLLQRGQSSGELRPDLSPEWMLHILNYALFAAWHSVHEGTVAKRDAPRMLLTTILRGIATE